MNIQDAKVYFLSTFDCSHNTHTPLTHNSLTHQSHTTHTQITHTPLTQHSHNSDTTLTQNSHTTHTQLTHSSHNTQAPITHSRTISHFIWRELATTRQLFSLATLPGCRENCRELPALLLPELLGLHEVLQVLVLPLSPPETFCKNLSTGKI